MADVTKSGKFVAIVTARYSSRRFPGKVLHKLHGRPMLAHTLDRLKSVDQLDEILVATSSDVSDEAIAEFAQASGFPAWRGQLDDVLGRLQAAASAHNADAIVRISGDSPLLDPNLIRAVLELFIRDRPDLATNVFPRSFPKGQSVEVVSRDALERLAYQARLAEDREHVTRYAYSNPGRFSIRNFVAETSRPELQLSVDTPADLDRAARLMVATQSIDGFPTVDQLIDLLDEEHR